MFVCFFLNPNATFHCDGFKQGLNCAFAACATFVLSMFRHDRNPSSSAARCGTQTPHRCSHFSEGIQILKFRLDRSTRRSLLSVKIAWRCANLVHEAEDLLHIRAGRRNLDEQGILVAPQQFMDGASGEGTTLHRIHPHVCHGAPEETSFDLVHYSLETDGQEKACFIPPVQLWLVYKLQDPSFAPLGCPLFPVCFPHCVGPGPSRLTQAGMLTVLMLSTVGSPTDFSGRNTKLLML